MHNSNSFTNICEINGRSAINSGSAEEQNFYNLSCYDLYS